MNNSKVFLISLLAGITLAGCNKGDSSICNNDKHYIYQPEIPAYWKLFHNTDGWIGADAAYSVPLSSQKTLWIYGDTWHGSICGNKRKDAMLVAHNSIAIQDGKDPLSATVKYYFGNNNSSFFEPYDNVGELWALHGTMIGSSLYLFMMQVTKNTSSSLGFELTDSRLIKINNPLEAPGKWQTTQYRIPHAMFDATKAVLFGASVIQQDGYVYIFGTSTDFVLADRNVLLARSPLDSLTEFNSWRFYNNGQWLTDYRQAGHITNRVGVEFSVSYQPKIKKYILITSEDGFSDKINMQTSDALWDHWTSPTTVYNCPEVHWGEKIFCYAAKGHPEISGENELIISYASNSFSIEDCVNNAEIYWPRFIKITF